MAIATVNPTTGQTLKTFHPLSDSQVENRTQRAASGRFFALSRTITASRSPRQSGMARRRCG
jgi:hypothetical protein